MNKNKKVLDSFIKYCEENPELRFWQALRNWSFYDFIYGGKRSPFHTVRDKYGLLRTITPEQFIEGLEDTFYKEGK